MPDDRVVWIGFGYDSGVYDSTVAVVGPKTRVTRLCSYDSIVLFYSCNRPRSRYTVISLRYSQQCALLLISVRLGTTTSGEVHFNTVLSTSSRTNVIMIIQYIDYRVSRVVAVKLYTPAAVVKRTHG